MKKSPDASRGHFLTIQGDIQVYKHYHKFFRQQIFDLVYSVCLMHTKLDCQKAKIEAHGGLWKIAKMAIFSQKIHKNGLFDP